MLLTRLALLSLVLLAACEEPKLKVDARWFGDASFDDGAAVISVYEGRFKKYGIWRDATVRDYVIREYLHPEELTKRDTPDGNIPVLKCNRLVTFTTGTYDYRLMSTLFFDRRTGALVKAVGSSQEGCGLAFQRWDRSSRRFTYDTYWEGEGAGSTEFRKTGGAVFADELPFLAGRVPAGAKLDVWPSLTRSKVRGFRGTSAVVARDGKTARAGDASFTYDDDGFLTAWNTPEQEFRRTKRTRLYYWQHTGPGDEKLLK